MALRIQQIACGQIHSMVSLSDGSVWATGANGSGQLGDGTHQDRFGWVQVMATGSGVVQVAAGGSHSFALKSDGSVWAAGRNKEGRLGVRSNVNKKSWFCIIPSGSEVVGISIGTNHFLVLKSDRSVWTTEPNWGGQVYGAWAYSKSARTSVIPSGVTQVVAGVNHSLALKSDGSVWATGANGNGQLGDGTNKDKITWTSVMPSGSDFIQVSASGCHSLALKSDGSVLATGWNYYGQLGDGTTVNKSTWISVISSGVTQVAAGYGHSFALKSDGSVWATGFNNDGQLGDGLTAQKSNWTSVIASGVAQLAVCSSHSLALKSDGTLWKTGDNDYGQLGQEGAGSTVWIPDRFFEQMLLESFLIDPPRSRRTLSETDSTPDTMPDAADDWPGLSL